MKANYPNIHRLVQTILTDGAFPGTTVIADLDGNDYEELPLISWRALNEGQYGHGLWRVNLVLQVVLDLEQTDMDDLLPHLYAQIHSWNEPGKGVIKDERLGVESVSDVAVFDTVSMAWVNGKHLTQFAAQFTLLVHDWS